MSKWPMRGHFLYLRFKTFPMTPRTPQCEVFWAFLLNSKHSGVPEDSKSPTFEVLGFTPTLGQSGVATQPVDPQYKWHLARSKRSEGRMRFCALRMLQNQGSMELRKQRMEKSLRPGNESPRFKHEMQGHHHGQHPMAP
jgi:hypothetical protein